MEIDRDKDIDKAEEEKEIDAILARHGIDAAGAFHVLVDALSDSHLRTRHHNQGAVRPAPTIMEALDIALYNEYVFNRSLAEENDRGDDDDAASNHDACTACFVCAPRADRQAPLIQALRDIQQAAEEQQALEDEAQAMLEDGADGADGAAA